MCFLLLLYSCANIVPPTGGEKDVSPPKPIDLNPPNLSVNFNSNKIELLFDEYVKIRDIENIQLSPTCNSPLKILKKGKKIEILIDCELDSNTTYTLNFGKSIVDLNEGNPLSNFKYVFSTGEKLDSLWLKGNVRELYFDEKKTNILVYLALIDDSAQSPYYYTFTNSLGEFVLENIKADNYKIYAVGDENNNLQYDSGELVSFPKQIKKLNESTEIGLFYEKSNSIKEVKNKYKNMVYFAHEPWTDSIQILNTVGIWDNNETTSSFWFTDSIEYIHYKWGSNHDSVLIKNTNNSPKLELNLQSKPHDIADNRAIIIKSNIPINNIVENLFTWNNINDPILPILLDPFTIKVPCEVQSLNEEILTIKSNAIESLIGSKSDSISFVINLNKEQFGILNIKAENERESVCLELFDGDNIIRKLKLKSNQTIQWIPPGNYRIRTYIDQNNNNFWDSGQLHESLENESIKLYPELLKIRANWELDVIIDSH